jgi:hypothetical protein
VIPKPIAFLAMVTDLYNLMENVHGKKKKKKKKKKYINKKKKIKKIYNKLI